MEKTVWNCPEVMALDLATVSGGGTTTLVSLAHRCVLADFDGDEPQDGIPYLLVTRETEQAAVGESYNGDWPPWDTLFDYIAKHRDLLSTAHYSDRCLRESQVPLTTEPARRARTDPNRLNSGVTST